LKLSIENIKENVSTTFPRLILWKIVTSRKSVMPLWLVEGILKVLPPLHPSGHLRHMIEESFEDAIADQVEDSSAEATNDTN